jgi:hypothetical protein
MEVDSADTGHSNDSTLCMQGWPQNADSFYAPKLHLCQKSLKIFIA